MAQSQMKLQKFYYNFNIENEFKKMSFLKMMPVKTSDEWVAYHVIRKAEIFDLVEVKYDINHFTLSHPSHYHFILYHYSNIIGVAHLEILDREKAALRPFAIKGNFKNRGFGTVFLKLIEKWLTHRKMKQIILHANPRAIPFYKRNGYYPMEFFEQREKITEIVTVDLGKMLR